MENNYACKEKHENINRTLEQHERRMNKHGERIDKIEQFQSRTETKIENLCEQIRSLVSTIRWALGVGLTTLLGFFIWYVQNIGG
ncbi:hemolysin XhlA family protein [Alkalibacter mobilis]|uniref:hemolysin XhlA family protein n=1 Tax=Alkalibacter mobilis TaxID=2787712 RepID=UPI00189E61D8|nr:hemolysin XhlA family protein [Alkalibacter mobilis]MBF7097570.1 hemolysin XhlA family protein [Alkalibacter mobilis]